VRSTDVFVRRGGPCLYSEEPMSFRAAAPDPTFLRLVHVEQLRQSRRERLEMSGDQRSRRYTFLNWMTFIIRFLGRVVP